MSEQGAVLILAGGRSSRMGTNKAKLQIETTTLLDWQRERLSRLNMPVWHSGPDGIVDIWSDFRGPMAGLYSALALHPEYDFWLVVPVDMPSLPVTRLRQLVHQGRLDQLPVAYSNTPLPLMVPNSEQLKATLETWLSQPDGPRSMHALMSHFHGRWLTESLPENECFNLNTPEDWSAFQLKTNSHPNSSIN